MKTGRTARVLVWAVTGLALGGCAGPEFVVVHRLPNALGMAPGAERWQVGGFTVAGSGQGGDLGACVRGALRRRLQTAAEAGPRHEAQALAGHVDGVIEVETTVHEGERQVWAAGDGPADTPRTVPSRVWQAEMSIWFRVQPSHEGATAVTVETRRQYDSRADARTRGEWGLTRGDSPELAPSAETVLREMADHCVEEFCDIVAWPQVQTTVRLQPLWLAENDRAVEAVRQGEWQVAQAHLEEAVAARPDSPEAHYNLAAVAEARGDLDLAVHHYEQAGRLGLKPADLAAQAARRVRRIRTRYHALAGSERLTSAQTEP